MQKSYLEITPFFPTQTSFRGPYIYDQVKAIERNSDFDVKVIKTISSFSKEPEVYEYQGVKVYNFKVFDLPSSVLPGLFHQMNLKRFENFLKTTVGIDLKDVEIIHAHVAYPAGALAVDLGKKHGIRSFVQHHGIDVMQLSNGRLLQGKLKAMNNSFIKRRFLKTVNNADLNIGVSQKVLNELNKVEGYRNTKEYVLYNGVDTNKFYKIKNYNKDDNVFRIGCIANFWKIKDQMTLLKAVDILVNQKGIKEIFTIFVGSGVTRKECENFVRQKHLEKNVEFKVEIDHTKLNNFYNSLDLFILPSYYEALGCVYTEALQVGVPIIAIHGQGISELLHKHDKDNFLIQKKDHLGLCKRIMHIKETHNNTSYDFNIDNFINEFLKEICC